MKHRALIVRTDYEGIPFFDDPTLVNTEILVDPTRQFTMKRYCEERPEGVDFECVWGFHSTNGEGWVPTYFLEIDEGAEQ
jgi:hypothetical protein